MKKSEFVLENQRSEFEVFVTVQKRFKSWPEFVVPASTSRLHNWILSMSEDFEHYLAAIKQGNSDGNQAFFERVFDVDVQRRMNSETKP